MTAISGPVWPHPPERKMTSLLLYSMTSLLQKILTAFGPHQPPPIPPCCSDILKECPMRPKDYFLFCTYLPFWRICWLLKLLKHADMHYFSYTDLKQKHFYAGTTFLMTKKLWISQFIKESGHGEIADATFIVSIIFHFVCPKFQSWAEKKVPWLADQIFFDASCRMSTYYSIPEND